MLRSGSMAAVSDITNGDKFVNDGKNKTKISRAKSNPEVIFKGRLIRQNINQAERDFERNTGFINEGLLFKRRANIERDRLVNSDRMSRAEVNADTAPENNIGDSYEVVKADEDIKQEVEPAAARQILDSVRSIHR